MLAFHRTTSLTLPFVVADGDLSPQPVNRAPKPLLWFTTSHRGNEASATDENSHQRGRSVRFGCHTSLLLPWQQAALAAGWSRAQIEAKAAARHHHDISLTEWLATSQPIPLRRLVLEVLVEEGKWRPVDTAELSAKRLTMVTLPVRNLVQAGPLARMCRRGKHVLTSCRMRYRDGRARYCRVEDVAGARC